MIHFRICSFFYLYNSLQCFTSFISANFFWIAFSVLCYNATLSSCIVLWICSISFDFISIQTNCVAEMTALRYNVRMFCSAYRSITYSAHDNHRSSLKFNLLPVTVIDCLNYLYAELAFLLQNKKTIPTVNKFMVHKTEWKGCLLWSFRFFVIDCVVLEFEEMHSETD